MSLKLLLTLLCIVWRLGSAEEFTNHWLSTDASSISFCSHDSFLNGSTCQCNVDYKGNFCLQRQCRNFGVNLNGNPDRCICPPGFLGRNCEPVKCVDGANQVYSSLPSEKTISILASNNIQLQQSWTTGNIGDIICNYTDYGRNFNYNYDNQGIQLKSGDTFQICISRVKTFLDPDTCTDDESGKSIPCQELNIDNLNSLVQKSLPNSIIFVVTNMKIKNFPIDPTKTEDMLATAIARKIQINVLVYNNTSPSLMASDPSLTYLQDIATATFGTFVLPSVNNQNQQYDIVNTLLDNWKNDVGVSNVYSNGQSLPVDTSSDLYISAQTYYNEDITINGNTLSAVVKTDFWKLYKLDAGSSHPILTISNIVEGTRAFVYSKNRLRAYTSFTSDETDTISISDASYSVSVLGATYPLVFRLEGPNGVLEAGDLQRTLGTAEKFTLGTAFNHRYSCQFNIALDATCNSVGASLVTLITKNNKNSVSFPIYCASMQYANSIYNNMAREIVDISRSSFEQSFAKEFSCGTEIAREVFAGRSFVIIADNTKDENSTLSSVDNVFRNKESVFLQLTDYANKKNIHYDHYIAAFQGSSVSIVQQNDYGKFLTKVMNKTVNAGPFNGDDVVAVQDLLSTTIENSNPYSDILFVVNFNISTNDSTVQAIKEELAKKRMRLYVLFVQTYAQTSNDAYRYLNDIAVSSGGVAVRLNGYDDLHAFFALYYSILVDNDIVAKAYSESQRPGIALSNVSLTVGEYYLLLTNNDLSDNGPVGASIVSNAGFDVVQLPSVTDLQAFKITVNTTGAYNILVKFAKLSQLANVILLTSTDNQDFVSLSFLDKNNKNRNDVVFGDGQYIPFLYISTPFNITSSHFSITYSDSADPAKPVYSGSIISIPTDCGFEYYKYYVNFPWICSQSGGLYHFKIDRSSESGTISRTFPITCLGASSGGCLNGGTKLGELCVCPLQWTGTNCEVPVCLNEGTATPADTCECTGAFTGFFCESSIATCIPPTAPYPDYRSDLSSLIIVADAQALAVSNLTEGLPITGVSMTVIVYGDGEAPRIVQSTTNGQRLTESLKTPEILATPAPDTNDMYAALNLAIDTQFTSRALIIVYTSNPDGDVDKDLLIRLAAKRAEIRVVSTKSTNSENFKTISLLGNGIPIVVENKFESYLKNYVAPIFSNLQYAPTVTDPQKVFNVFQTGSFEETGLTVKIPSDTTFDRASAIAFVQVNGGFLNIPDVTPSMVGSTNIYQIPYNQTGGLTLNIQPGKAGGNGTYSIETLNYLKTAYGFSNLTNGANEQLVAGLVFGQKNVLSVYSSPFSDAANSNPANFPYLSISEIRSNGTLSDSKTILFTRKNNASCFYKHFTVLDVCSQGNTIGYQVQLTTRTSTLGKRQQQFVLSCHKTSYQKGDTTCAATGSPDEICKCDPGYEGIDCQTPQCVKGGVLAGTFCRCPVPYYGRRCEKKPEATTTSTPAGTTTNALISSTVAPTTVISTLASTVQTTTEKTTIGTTQTTTAPPPFRAVAFVVDVIGSDDYAFNSTIQSIVSYVNAFNYVHHVLITTNIDFSYYPGFKQYQTNDSLISALNPLRDFRDKPADTKVASLEKAIVHIQNIYNDQKNQFEYSLSNNIFYLTQIALESDDKPDTTGLTSFDTSSLVYSPFAKNADQSIMDSLKTFSPIVNNVRDYYNGVKTMTANTKLNESAILPEKPNRQCTFGLQTNIMVIPDLSSPSTQTIQDNLVFFLNNFRQGFNYIENDIDRCHPSTTIPGFYKERTAITSLAYYSSYIDNGGSFCPSQYTTMMNNPTKPGAPLVPGFTDAQVKSIGKLINRNICSCSRFDDTSTMKVAVWLPRSKGPANETFQGYLKYKTTNAYHFVVPFYDMNDKDNDLFYQILKDQSPENPDFFLLPNAAAADSVADIIATLYEKICSTAGVDPTAIPPEMNQIHSESKNGVFYDDYFESESHWKEE